MPKVYAPQIPSRFDAATKLWIPKFELGPAAKFGELVVLLPPDAHRAGIEPCKVAMAERMASYSEDDYVMSIGHPALLGIACALAAKATGGLLRQLSWDKMVKDYLLVESRI